MSSDPGAHLRASAVRAIVVVLGELGRSPRMMFHACALAGEGLDVDLIGTEIGELPARVRDNPRIAVHALAAGETRDGADAPRHRSLIGMAARGFRLLFSLARLLLWRLPAPALILVQNPPGVPTMAAAWLAARLRGARLAVDWHNLTSAMLAMQFGRRHALVELSARYEGLFGRAADTNLFVSSHMQQSLLDRFRVTGHVFRDRPADTFVPLDDGERQRVRASVLARFGAIGADPALLVSATSWTADENLDLLLEGLRRYDAHARLDSGHRLPSLAVLITGSGALKRAFEARVAEQAMERVAIRTGWIEADEYPRVIAAADLGICCHTSASGLDLPMKVTDLFGAGIPVCAYDYGPCLRELVRPEINGVLFTTSEECCAQLERVLAGGPRANALLAALKGGVRESAGVSWGAGWTAEARSALLGQHQPSGPALR